MGDYRSTAATGARPLGTSIPGQLALLLWHAVEVHTGSQWRHRPNEYGKWNSVFRRYRQWVETDVFDAVLQTLAELAGADNAAHLIDGTIIPAHYCAVGKKKGTQNREALGRSRGSFSTEINARCDGKGRPLGFVLTPGQTHDIQAFSALLRMIVDRIATFLGEKGYDADELCQELQYNGIEAVIPPKRNRKAPILYDRDKSKERNCIERMFNKLKNWRHVATR